MNTRWSHDDGEFVRHLIYRLAKGRHFRFAVDESNKSGVDGTAIAIPLFEAFESTINAYVSLLDEPITLCYWAETLVRIRKFALAQGICQRIVGDIENRKVIAGFEGGAFVTLSVALTKNPQNSVPAELQNSGLELLDLQYALNSPTNSPLSANEDTQIRNFRMNQIVHSYCQLLWSMGKELEALAILRDLPPTFEPDSLTLLLTANLEGRIGDVQCAREWYENAIDLSSRIVRRSPGVVVQCLVGYGDFLIRRNAYLEASEQFYEAMKRIEYFPERYRSVRRRWVSVLSRMNPNQSIQKYHEHIESIDDSGKRDIDAHLALAKHYIDDFDELQITEEQAYSKAEALYETAIAIAIIEEPRRKAPIVRELVTNLIATKTYVSESGLSRPDYSESEDLLMMTFESDPSVRDNDLRKTFDDAQAHASLAHLYRTLANRSELEHNRGRYTELAGFHFERAYLGLPRNGMDWNAVCGHVLKFRLQHLEFNHSLGQSVVDGYVELLETLTNWSDEFGRDRVSSLTEIARLCTYILQFVEVGSLKESLIRILPPLVNFETVTSQRYQESAVIRVANVLRGQALNLVNDGREDEAAQFFDASLNALDIGLENNPADVDYASHISIILRDRRLQMLRDDKIRISNGMALALSVLSRCPNNQGAISSILRLGELLPSESEERRSVLADCKCIFEKSVPARLTLNHVLGQMQPNRWPLTTQFVQILLHDVQSIDEQKGTLN